MSEAKAILAAPVRWVSLCETHRTAGSL